MPDPVSTAAAASAPSAVGTGVSAIAVAALGVDIQALSVGLVGAIRGLTFAAPTSPVHAVARFLASAVFSAISGSAAGERFGLTLVARNAVIGAAGIVLHLALDWIGRRFGQIADAGARKAGIDVGEQ